MNTNQIAVKMILDRWNALIKNADTILASMSDEQLMSETIPGKNRGIYLLGHLIAVHDDMLTLLDMGEKMFPDLFELFIKSPDKAHIDIPSIQELRGYWQKQNEVLTSKFTGMKADEWFERHMSVTPEDFIKEPHRNKLNIIITRASHLSYHLGQLVMLK